jgi:P27 family predicted phage terminase small subunit
MGNFLSGRRTETSVANQDGQTLVMPADLAPELQAYWGRVVAQLPDGVATAADAQLIVQLCQALYVQGKAWGEILSDGITTLDAAHGGEMRRHPSVITWRQAADMARQCMSLLGLSPVSRARIQADSSAGSVEFIKYLQRRHGDSA